MRIGIVDEALTRELRRGVLRPNLPPGAPLPGDDLPNGVHIAATDDDGTALCTCFVYADDCPWLPDRTGAWHLRQMATATGLQGKGIGGAVLDAAVEYVAAQGAPLLWCNARVRAVPFYERHGFVGHGELFVPADTGIPHRAMYRELSGRPTSSG